MADEPEIPDDMASLFDPTALKASIEVLRRAGMREFQVRVDTQDDPPVFMVLAKVVVPLSLNGGPRSGWKLGSGTDPMAALRNLIEDALDGAQCAHCHKPVVSVWAGESPALPDTIACYRTYDGQAFRRGCASNISN